MIRFSVGLTPDTVSRDLRRGTYGSAASFRSRLSSGVPSPSGEDQQWRLDRICHGEQFAVGSRNLSWIKMVIYPSPGCITTRCSGRLWVSRPLRLLRGRWLRTVMRKGRATRPAAERRRNGD